MKHPLLLVLPFIVSARRLAALALLLAVGPLAPAARAQSAAPFGISHMQVGLQASWSSQMTEPIKFNSLDQLRKYNHYYGIGPNGRLQWSLVDMLTDAFKSKTGAGAFRITDVMAFEAGAGYMRQTDEVSAANIMWWNWGLDVGLAGLYRVTPKLDVGLKCRYAAYSNATFRGGVSGYQAYGGLPVWSGLARVGRFHGECSLMRGYRKGTNTAYPTYVNVLDLKYRYGKAEGRAWAPYVGLQVGMGTTTVNEGYPGIISSFSRNWVQVSIGKMSNF